MRILHFSILLLVMSCSNDPAKEFLVINKVRQLSDLATTEVVLKKYVLANKEKKFWFVPLKDATFAAETYAYLKFGIDLNSLDQKNISIEGSTIILNIPEIKLISFDYPPSQHKELAYLSNRSQRLNYLSIEQTEKVLREAQDQIGRSIDFFNIEHTLKENTESILLSLLNPFGISNVIVRVEENTINKTKFFQQ